MARLLGVVEDTASLTHTLLVEHLFEALAVTLIEHLGDILIVASHLFGQRLKREVGLANEFHIVHHLLDLFIEAVFALLVQQALILGCCFLLLVNCLSNGLCISDLDIKQLYIFLIEVPDVIALLDIAANKQKKKESNAATHRLAEVTEAIESLKGATIQYDDEITRRLVDCVRVLSADEIEIRFKGREPQRYALALQ